jgi:preprotein translocase subunit SecE
LCVQSAKREIIILKKIDVILLKEWNWLSFVTVPSVENEFCTGKVSFMAVNNKIRPNPSSRSGTKYFSEIWAELKKVTWPTRREAIRLTLLVLAISGAIGAVLSLVDIGFSRLFQVLTGT